MKLVEKIKGMNLLEKFKNKKVFALYLVGVLLLSTGISFAYLQLELMLKEKVVLLLQRQLL